MTYTNGPWHAIEGNPRSRGMLRYPTVYATDNDLRYICHCADTFNFHEVTDNLANARLIAAAPCLLEALTRLLDRYTGLVNCGDCGFWDPETEDEVIAARAAISKALGEQ